jgi:asparagine N-glycosylation enzyme membrane subunit Stt3
MNTDLIDALNWIRENTPVTSGYADKKPPEYGILANWGEGNKIAYYARRPVLVNNAHWGYKKMAEIFTARSEKEAAELCQKHKARYIYIEFRKISDDRIDFLDMYKKKENATYDVFSFTTDYVPPDPPVASYTDTFHYWLSDNLGILPTGDFESPSENFRIIYSSRQINRFTSPKVLLYEFVKGCEIHGIADPKTEVVISTGCRLIRLSNYIKEVL